MTKGFNHRERRYTYAILRGMTLSKAEEKKTERRRLAPQYLWAIKRTSDGTYGLGRASRR